MRLLVVMLALALPAAAKAAPPSPDMTVFGQALNEPLSLPECEKKVQSWQGPKGKPMYGSTTDNVSDAPCWQTYTPYAESPEAFNPDGTVTLLFPRAMRPVIMATDKAKIRLREGRVIAVELDPGGVDRQAVVAAALIEKYGKPHKLRKGKVQNRMGATFAAAQAEWNFPTLHVEYDPIAGSTLDEGSLTIKTEAAYRVDEQQAEDKKAARKKL